MSVSHDAKPSIPPADELVEDRARVDSAHHVDRRDKSPVRPPRRDSAAVGGRAGRPRHSHYPSKPTLVFGVDLLFKYKWLLSGFLIGSAIVAWGAIVAWPRRYESEARLLLRLGNENISVSPTVISKQTLVVEKSTNEEVNSTLSLLSSRGFAERVVDRLGPDVILAGNLPADATEADVRANRGASSQRLESVTPAIRRTIDRGRDALFNALVAMGIKQPLSDREVAVRELLGSVRVTAPKESSVVSIHCQAASSDLAQRIVQCYVDEFMEHRLSVFYTGGARDFFEEQVRNLADDLAETKAKRAIFLKQHRLVSVDANLKVLAGQLDAVEQDILSTESDLQQVVAEIAQLKDRIEEIEDEIVASKEAVFDETWSGMRQTVYELELREQELAAKYEESYPPLQQVREQLAGARAILDRMNEERVNRNTTPNPVKLKLQTDLEVLQSRRAGLESRLKEERRQKEALQQRISELHDLDEQLARMDRDIAVMERALVDVRDKLEQARMIEGLQRNKISSVSVAQPPTYVERPAVPNKKLLAAVIVFLGMSMGVGLVLAREANAMTIRDAAQLARLGSDVLAEVPFVKRLSRTRDAAVAPGRFRKALEPLLPSLEKLISALLMRGEPYGGGGPLIGVLAANRRAGASTICAGLATAAGRHPDLRILVIDADWAGRGLTRRVGAGGRVGLWELARQEIDADQCVIDSGLGFDFLPAGGAKDDESQEGAAASHPDVPDVVSAIAPYREEYDIVILDLPSADRGSSILPMARLVDALLCVVEFERTSLQDAMRTTSFGGLPNNPSCACVVTKVRSYTPRWIRRLLAQPTVD